MARRNLAADHVGLRTAEADYARQVDRQRSRRVRTVEEDPGRYGGRFGTAGRRPSGSLGRHQPSAKPESGVGEETPSYTMEVITQPPASARAGMILGSTVTARLRRSDGRSYTEASELAGLFAVATLAVIGPDGAAEMVAPGVLTGPRLVDSVRRLPESEGVASDTVGYASFPNLIIRQEGTYRIVISLIRMGGTPPQMQGGSSVQAVYTRHISVERNPASGVQLGEQSLVTLRWRDSFTE